MSMDALASGIVVEVLREGFKALRQVVHWDKIMNRDGDETWVADGLVHHQHCQMPITLGR